MLGSARCLELETEAGQHAAISSLARAEVDALIVIGGNGAQAGAHALCGRGVDVVGVASTIEGLATPAWLARRRARPAGLAQPQRAPRTSPRHDRCS